MAKEQEKEKKDTGKGKKADPKAKAKSGRAAAGKRSAKAEPQEEAKAGPEQNIQPAPEAEAAPASETESPSVAKPKKRGRPKRKPANKPPKVQEEQAAAAIVENDTKATALEPDAPQEKTAEVQDEASAEVKEASTVPKKSRSGRRSGSRKKKTAKKAEEPAKAVEEAQEKTSEEPVKERGEAVQDKTSNQAVDSPEGNIKPEEAPAADSVPTEEKKPRKKKNRKKKPKKKEAAAPPMEEVPAPIVVQENKVVIASKNPSKVKAVELAYGRMFPDAEYVFESISVASGVGDQPMSDDETFAGALYRAQMARQEVADAGYWIGLEGGLEEIGDEFHAFAWMIVLGRNGIMGKARTATFVLPYAVAELIRDGKELGEADDIVFEKHNSKEDIGAVGILTHGLIDRAQYYSEAMIMALIPFKNPEHFPAETIEKEIV